MRIQTIIVPSRGRLVNIIVLEMAKALPTPLFSYSYQSLNSELRREGFVAEIVHRRTRFEAGLRRRYCFGCHGDTEVRRALGGMMPMETDSARNERAVTGTICLPKPAVSEVRADVSVDRSETVVTRLLTASHRLRSVLADHYAQFDLSDVRHSVLQILRDAAPDGCSQSQLADRLGQSESSVCMLVKRMRDAELLYRLRSRFDRRNWVLNLTERGNALLQRVEECHPRRMRQMLSGLTSGELNSLSTLLQRFADELVHTDLALFDASDSPAPGHGDNADDSRDAPIEKSAPGVILPPAA